MRLFYFKLGFKWLQFLDNCELELNLQYFFLNFISENCREGCFGISESLEREKEEEKEGRKEGGEGRVMEEIGRKERKKER